MNVQRVLLLSATAVLAATTGSSVDIARAQGGFGFGPPGEEIPVVSQFDADRNGRLSDEERAKARAWLAANPRPGGFGRQRYGSNATPGARVSPKDVPSAGAAPLYDADTVRTIFIDFPGADWERELADFYNTDVEVPATVTVDGRRYPEVGIHFRGMSSFRMVPAGSKRSLNLAFDFANSEQRLQGYRTLNLLNANGDPSFLRSVLYAEIARRYIPFPRTNYVRVVINGELWGVYVNVQQFNSDFTRDFFSSTRGARWKVPGSPRGRAGLEYFGDNVEAYRRIFDIRSRDNAESWQALIALCRILNTTPAASLEAALAPILDIDGTLKFLALDVALVNSDGYWARASDYNLYRDESGRFHVLPHDTNEGFSDGRGPGPGFGGGEGGTRLDPLVGLDDTAKPLRSKLLAVPALRKKYLGYVHDIAERELDWRTLGPVATKYRTLIAPHVRADTKKLYSTEAFEAASGEGTSSVKVLIDRRRAFLLGQQQ